MPDRPADDYDQQVTQLLRLGAKLCCSVTFPVLGRGKRGLAVATASVCHRAAQLRTMARSAGVVLDRRLRDVAKTVSTVELAPLMSSDGSMIRGHLI